MFPYKWTAKLTKHRFFIKLSLNLIKTLKIACNLMVLDIKKKISLILRMILLTVENENYQREIIIHQNLVFIGSENKDILKQNNPRYPKRKQNGENKGSQEA